MCRCHARSAVPIFWLNSYKAMVVFQRDCSVVEGVKSDKGFDK